MKNKLTIIVLVGGDYDKKLYEKCKKTHLFAGEIIEIKTKEVGGSFAEWRNEGLKRAKGDWMLYVDTDEEISTTLRAEVTQLISKSVNQCTAYAIPRRNIIFGKEFKHGGQYPDYQKRLFKKNALEKWIGEVHEEPVLKKSDSQQMRHLKNPLIHHKNSSLTDMIEKTNKWSEIEAKLLFESNHPKMNFLRFASAGFREFWLRFVRQTCFLDGTRGIIYGMYQVYSRLISYSKLWEMQIK